MNRSGRWTRRSSLKGLGLVGAGAWIGGGRAAAGDEPASPPGPAAATDLRRAIAARVESTPFVDTHEHLSEEGDRLAGVGADDWSLLLAGYLGSDLLTAGMPRADFDRFFSRGPAPEEKWRLLEPHWPAVRTTGYGLAARHSIRQLYGVDDLSAATVGRVQQGYEALRKPGSPARCCATTRASSRAR